MPFKRSRQGFCLSSFGAYVLTPKVTKLLAAVFWSAAKIGGMDWQEKI